MTHSYKNKQKKTLFNEFIILGLIIFSWFYTLISYMPIMNIWQQEP